MVGLLGTGPGPMGGPAASRSDCGLPLGAVPRVTSQRHYVYWTFHILILQQRPSQSVSDEFRGERRNEDELYSLLLNSTHLLAIWPDLQFDLTISGTGL